MKNRSQHALTASETNSSTGAEEERAVSALALHGFAVDDCDVWRDYWRARKQPWRTEQEIEPERQVELSRESTALESGQGRFPFRDIKLSRADVEWLLASHEASHGPVDATGGEQKACDGLDLRGADLRKARLAGLPLTCMLGGLCADEWLLATNAQREAAAVLLGKADLRGAHLEGAVLCGAHLEEADLRGAHLEGADLRGARLAGSTLCGAHLEGADLSQACLQGDENVPEPADLRMAFFDSTTNLQGITLGDEKYGSVPLANVRWGGVNLAAVNWAEVYKLGDEYKTQWKLPVEYQGAIQANRQLAAALRAQGLGAVADHFAYRAHVNQRSMRLQQALLPVVLRVCVRERMPLPKVLLRLEERRYGQLPPRHPLALALVRLSPLLFLLLLLVVLKPLVPLVLLAGCLAAFLAVLPAMRKRKQHPPLYRRAHRQLPPPGLLPQRQRRGQQWLLLMGFVLGTPESRLPLLLKSPAVALQQVPFIRRVRERFGGRSLPVITAASLLLLLLLLDDAMLCYGRYVFSCLLDALTGYGYKPARSLFWYLIVVLGFAALYAAFGHVPAQEALIFSLASFHGGGFFAGGGGCFGIPALAPAAVEAAIGLIIEISFVASWIHRLCEK